MYGISTHKYHTNQANVGKYTIPMHPVHGYMDIPADISKQFHRSSRGTHRFPPTPEGKPQPVGWTLVSGLRPFLRPQQKHGKRCLETWRIRKFPIPHSCIHVYDVYLSLVCWLIWIWMSVWQKLVYYVDLFVLFLRVWMFHRSFGVSWNPWFQRKILETELKEMVTVRTKSSFKDDIGWILLMVQKSGKLTSWGW